MNYFSHAGQDRLVATVLKYRRDGYFLDFGAFDGVNDSNTFYFEKALGWRGICVEPNPLWYASTCAVRSCVTVNNALWSESRKSLEFVDAHGLSSLSKVKDCDSNAELRNQITQRTMKVDTINPTELLERFSAPNFIEYMSLDVEGVELTVLESLDLVRYRIAMMTIEHNHTTDKQMAIRDCLARYGYDVIEFYNDDFFYNLDLIRIRCGNDFCDPCESVKDVMANYKIRVY